MKAFLHKLFLLLIGVLFAIAPQFTEAQKLEDFYNYTLLADSTYKVSLNDSLRNILANSHGNISYVSWNEQDPLPNPAPDGKYSGIPVTDMDSMFLECYAVSHLDLSKFDTRYVTRMDHMFEWCYCLESIDLHSFNTSNLVNMDYMFVGCSSLKNIDLSSFSTNKIKKMDSMFAYCYDLNTIDISNFNIETKVVGMFDSDSNLRKVDIHNGHINIQKATSSLFDNCGCDYNSYVVGLIKTKDNADSINIAIASTNSHMKFIGVEKPILEKFYNYSILSDNSYKVSLTDSFKTAINSNKSHSDKAGYSWNPGEPIPNPAIDGKYQDKPVTNMSGLFAGCDSIASINLSEFDTSNVTDMSEMFSDCQNLSSLDISDFDIRNVTDMHNMLENCYNIQKLNIHNFDIPLDGTVNISSLFTNCGKSTNGTPAIAAVKTDDDANGLNASQSTTGIDNTKIKFSGFHLDLTKLYNYTLLPDNTYKVELTDTFRTAINKSQILKVGFYTWHGTDSIPNPDPLGMYSGKPVTDMSDLFAGLNYVDSLKISNIDTRYVTNMNRMFYNCQSLLSLDVSNFDTRNVTNMDSLFAECRLLTYLDVSNFNTSKVTRMNSTFLYCESVPTLDVSHFDTSKVTDMSMLFAGCRSLDLLDITNFNTSKVTNMDFLFAGCADLKSLDLSKIDTSNTTSMVGMFDELSSLNTLDVNSLSTSKVTDMGMMFAECYNLTSLNLNNFDTSNVTDMCEMFDECNNLASLNLNSFNTSNVTNMNSMFDECTNLVSLNLNSFNTSKVTSMEFMFDKCTNLASLNLNSFDTRNVTDMYSMFNECTNLKSLDISNFDITNTTNMCYMFTGCKSLTSLDMHTFDVPTDDSVGIFSMFEDCGMTTNGKPAKGIVKSKANATALNASQAKTGLDTTRLMFVDEVSGTELINSNNATIYTSVGTINIIPSDESTINYSIYDCNGVVVSSGTINGTTSINVPAGIYIVKIPQLTQKVIVK